MAITVTANGSTTVTVTAPASTSLTVTEKGAQGPAGADGVGVPTAYTLPASDGSANQVFVTDGSGSISFAAVPGLSTLDTKVDNEISQRQLGDSSLANAIGANTASIATANSNISSNTTKLSGIEAGATADQTNAEIRAAVEAASDSNVFTDADHTKLNAIEASADVTDEANVKSALDGMTLSDIGSPASTDRVLIQDADDSNNIKYVNFSEFGGGGGSGDITSVVAGTGLTGGATSGDATLNVVGGTGITANANDIAITDGGVGTTQLADDSVTEAKLDNTLLAEIDANTAKATNVTTDLGITGTTGARTITSSDGTNAVIPVATDAVSGVMSAADHAKLSGIEASADVTDTDNVRSSGALMDDEVTNLAQVKAFDSSDYATAAQGAKADSAQQPPSEGAFANGDKTKLDGIEAGATADQTQADINGLAITTVVALSSGSISSDFGNIDNGSSTLNTGAATVASLVLGGHSVDDIDLGGEFVDSDNHLMSAAAINDRFAQINASTTGNAATATALATARNIAGVSFDGTADISLNNNAITNGAGYTTNTGTVDTTGTPVANDFAKFTDANTIEGRSIAEVKSDLSLNNVENTAISTFAGTSNITTVGTIGTGTWQGTAIASAYLDADTAHLSGTQTFTGAKTFSDSIQVDNINVNANTISSTDTNGNVLLAANGTGKIEVRGNTNSGAVVLNCEANTHGITIQAPAHSAFGGSYTLTLPPNVEAGDANKVLQTDASGNLDWVALPLDTNTQNTTTLSFVDSSDDIILRNTTGGAGSGTQDITINAGSNITLTHTDANNITIAASGSGGSSTFLGLSDTPGTFTASKFLKVNSSGNAIEFVDASSTGDSTEAQFVIQSTAVNAAGEAEGTIVKFGDDSTTAGKVYTFSSGTWVEVDANDEAKTKGLLGMALGANSTTNGMLVHGVGYLNHDPGSAGDILYVSHSATGQISSAQPSDSADFVRVVGHCLANNKVFFSPSQDYIDLA